MRVKMNIGQLVLDQDVYDIIKRHAKMTAEFKSYFEDIRNPSMVAAATSPAMVENCILLQTSISNFSVRRSFLKHRLFLFFSKNVI